MPDRCDERHGLQGGRQDRRQAYLQTPTRQRLGWTARLVAAQFLAALGRAVLWRAVLGLAVLGPGSAQALQAEAPPAKDPNTVPGQSAQTLDTQVRIQCRYLWYEPEADPVRQRWPLLLFLHGAGERGDDLQQVQTHGPPKLIAQGKHYPMYVASPQCPAEENWEPFRLMTLVDDLCRRYPIDEERIYVTGLSMGGFATWQLGSYAPDRFAALVPICGGGEPYWTRRFAHVAVWAFHGARDEGVPLLRSQEMIAGLLKHGGHPRFTVYPEMGHDSWTETYANPQWVDWLLEQRRKPRGNAVTTPGK